MFIAYNSHQRFCIVAPSLDFIKAPRVEKSFFFAVQNTLKEAKESEN